MILLCSFLLSAAVGLALPLALAAHVERRWEVPRRVIVRGALVFLLFQVVTGLPLLKSVEYLLGDTLKSARLAWLVVAALTAGLFEEVGRYVGYRWWAPEARDWQKGVAFGLGHGGLEMFLLGGLGSLAGAIGAAAYALAGSEARAPLGQEDALAAARALYATMPAWMPLLGAFERVASLTIQVSLSLMVLRVFTGGGPAWLTLAIGYHTLVEFATVFTLERAGAVAAEIVVALFAALSVGLILRVSRWSE